MSGQHEVIGFLSRADSYGCPGGTVERIETHRSLIFLCSERVYKLKREIAYASLDFLTLENRERACRAELRLNRRTAPDLYLEVRPITRGAGGLLQFDSAGQVVDWVVVMRRFPQQALFDRMAEKGLLTRDLIRRLGSEIARFHASAEITPQFGGAEGIREAIETNHGELCQHSRQLDATAIHGLYREQLHALGNMADLLDQRRRDGHVRRCHGDMRLANICLFEGRPTLFDGIEFSDRIACIDVLYDLAFVLVDLRHHDLAALADLLLECYLAQTQEEPLPLPLFLSVRAATRSFTLAGRSQRQHDPLLARHKIEQARALLQRANAYLSTNATV
jgi:aminoglycoside phosphotransferase family enzyme